jgi:hypothetical protein
MFKKLLSLLFGKKELKTIPTPCPIPVISIHEEIKKTLEEVKGKKSDIIGTTKLAKESPKAEKTKTPKVKAPNVIEVKKTSAKKKAETTAAKEKAKKGPKKSK